LILYLPEGHSVDHAIPFLQESLYLLGPIDEARPQGMPVAFADLKGLPIHHTSRIHACRLLLDSASSKQGVALDIVAELDSITLLYEFVAKRGAMTIFPCIGEPPLFQRAVDYRRIVDPDLTLQSYIVAGANRPKSKTITAVAKMLTALAEEMADSERCLELQLQH
jgi:LysR family nitrogen assimilation transcriptional regulator